MLEKESKAGCVSFMLRTVCFPVESAIKLSFSVKNTHFVHFGKCFAEFVNLDVQFML